MTLISTVSREHSIFKILVDFERSRRISDVYCFNFKIGRRTFILVAPSLARPWHSTEYNELFSFSLISDATHLTQEVWSQPIKDTWQLLIKNLDLGNSFVWLRRSRHSFQHEIPALNIVHIKGTTYTKVYFVWMTWMHIGDMFTQQCLPRLRDMQTITDLVGLIFALQKPSTNNMFIFEGH